MLGIAVVVAIAGVMALWGGESSDEASKEKHPLKMIVVKDLGDVGLVQEIAKKEGFFEKNGVRIEPVVLEKISDTRNVNTVLLSGEADMLMTGVSGELAVYLNDADVRWIATTFKPFSFFAVSRFAKEDMQKVRNVGVIRFGGEPAMITDAMLKGMQIDPSKVKLIAIPTNMARKELLDKGDLDLIVINSEQFIYESGMDKKYTIVPPEELFADSELYRGIMTTRKVIERDPEAVQGFVAAIYQTMEYMKANPDAVKKYMQEAYKYSPEQTEQSYARFARAYEGIGLLPRREALERTVEQIKAQFKPTNPTRSIEGFIVDSFARTAITADER